MNGLEWLEQPQEWDGHFIPIIEDSGNRYNVGGDTIIEGMVQPAISPCRMLNYMVSSAAEKIGLAAASPWLAVAGQLQGYEAWWNQANTRNFPFLEYNAMTAATGPQLLPPPSRNNDEPAIQAFAEMISLFTNFIRSTTGVPDAALGHVNPNDRSGKAIEELKMASQQGTSGWLTHHARAIRQTGIVVIDLLPAIYDAPGRVERIIGKDGSEDFVMLNAPFVQGQDGQPQAAPPNSPQAQQAQAQQQPITAHMLQEGQYGVIVTVGKSPATLKAETFAGMNALAQAAPELVPRFADLWVESMDIPQADAIAARIRPPGVGDEANPQQMQAEMAQLKQALQEAQQLADDNQTKLKIAEAREQAENQRTAAKLQSQDEQARAKNETAITVAELSAKVDRLTLFLSERERIGVQGHEHDILTREQQHEMQMAQMAHQQALQQGQVDQANTLEQGDQGHQQARELQDVEHGQQAAMATVPPPVDPNKQVAE